PGARRRPGPGAAARPRVLLAPVTITPSKPLMPSHLKGLFWTDVMYRATACLADVDYRFSHTTYHLTEQTLAFWEFLDRTQGDTGYAELTEDDIGSLYVRHRAAKDPVPAAALRPYADAVEHHGWVHPAATRVLELWRGHYAGLGLHDPGLLDHQPPGLGLEEALEHLRARGLCLDHRGLGGPVYLDLTRHGLPLRQIVTADGRPNYLACALRELLPLAPHYDEVVFLYDRELDPDYQLLARVLGPLGPVVHRVTVGRVPVDGRIRSARSGGWRGVDANALLDAARADHDEPRSGSVCGSTSSPRWGRARPSRTGPICCASASGAPSASSRARPPPRSPLCPHGWASTAATTPMWIPTGSPPVCWAAAVPRPRAIC
ncbi:hypothetical protein, partial [Streptomyces sp. YS-3]|uniref:hypothetical protein n=1 Tax=Streptomyces sp. YS-3 TaxID=3381352 RepID=UPI003862253D